MLITFLGDSLYAPGQSAGCPTKFYSCIRMWTKEAFGEHFKHLRNSLEHVTQTDTFSCGLITANTIEHAVFNHSLIDPCCILDNRLAWFIRLASNIFKSVPAIVNQEIDDAPISACRPTIANLLNPVAATKSNYGSDYSDTSSMDLENSESESDLELEGGQAAKDDTESRRAALDAAMEVGDSSMEGISKKSQPVASASGSARTNKRGKKRSRSLSELDDDTDSDATTRGRQKYVKPGNGTSKSATADRNQREMLKAGTFVVNKKYYRRWQEKILKTDKRAVFDESNIRRVRHSVCGTVVTMKAPYNATRWQEHLEDCAAKKSLDSTSTQTLLQMNFFTWGKAPQALKPTATVPCPGITEDVAPKVKAYLRRTAVLGSGG